MNLAFPRLIGFVATLFITQVVIAFSVVDFADIQFQTGRPTPASVIEDSLKLPLARSSAFLEQAAHTLQGNPKIKVRIVGFTDDHECSNSRECKELSLRRAKGVYDWLLTHGVASGQVTAVEGKGSDEPIGSNDLESGRQYNRRVEIQVL